MNQFARGAARIALTDMAPAAQDRTIVAESAAQNKGAAMRDLQFQIQRGFISQERRSKA